jgi:hypothetical protein
MLAVAILGAAHTSVRAENDAGGSPRIPKIEEGAPAPWLEYYRRERGSGWPASSPNEGLQPGTAPVAPAGEPPAAGQPDAGHERSAVRSSPADIAEPAR